MLSLAAFARTNMNGWCLLAVNESADSVSQALRAEPDFISVQEDIDIQSSRKSEHGDLIDAEGNLLLCTVHPDRRSVVLVEPAGCKWTVILRSIGFAYVPDIDWVRKMAQQLSKSLTAKTLSCCGDVVVCDLRVFVGGKSVKQRLGCDTDEAAELIENLGIKVPGCFLRGDPPQIWADEATRNSVQRASLFTIAVPVNETSTTPRRGRLPAERMIASQCLEIVKLKQFVPFQVRSEQNSFETTVVEVVFDPLQIDEVNGRFKQAGFHFDDELMKVLAVNADGSLLLWHGISMVDHLRPGEPKATRALNDILDLTFPFKIKNKKAETDALLAKLRELEDEDG